MRKTSLSCVAVLAGCLLTFADIIAFKGIFPFNHVLKYVWSTVLPEGTIIKSPYYSGERIVVVHTGPEDIGKWIMEERNIFNDYTTAFKSTPPSIIGIAIQSDSDNTKTSASADFADIIVSRN